MSWLYYRPAPEIYSFLKPFISLKFWQCIHPSLYRSRTKEQLVPTIIRSFYNFTSDERAPLPEFTDFLNQFPLVVVDKILISLYRFSKRLGLIADTTFIFGRIHSRDILTQQTRADKLDAQFKKVERSPLSYSKGF